MGIAMDPTILAALIGAGATLVAALIAVLAGRQQSNDLAAVVAALSAAGPPPLSSDLLAAFDIGTGVGQLPMLMTRRMPELYERFLAGQRTFEMTLCGHYRFFEDYHRSAAPADAATVQKFSENVAALHDSMRARGAAAFTYYCLGRALFAPIIALATKRLDQVTENLQIVELVGQKVTLSGPVQASIQTFLAQGRRTPPDGNTLLQAANAASNQVRQYLQAQVDKHAEKR